MYELTRTELLRDLFLWAYERSTQEYLAIKQDLAEPDPLRLAYRDLIKQTIRDVVTHPDRDPIGVIQLNISQRVDAPDRDDVKALAIEELRRLHEGVLARYGLRPAQFFEWQSRQRETNEASQPGFFRGARRWRLTTRWPCFVCDVNG